jgi:TetR/AcrR family transcriptional regulator, regulator of autoinduction and epiphytic fitness
MSRLSFREQVLRAREDAILESVNRLLAEKGFDLMTVDEVAADVGIAKASLYKHFTSKEELAAAAMVRVLDRAQRAIDEIEARPGLDAVARLKEVARWTMRVQLAGEMPSLPAQNSSLRTALVANRNYLDRVMLVSDRLGAWISAAQSAGQLDARLPAEVALYTLFARACDPVLGMLKASGAHSHEAIIEMLVSTCFDGLSGLRPGAVPVSGAASSAATATAAASAAEPARRVDQLATT